MLISTMLWDQIFCEIIQRDKRWQIIPYALTKFLKEKVDLATYVVWLKHSN